MCFVEREMNTNVHKTVQYELDEETLRAEIRKRDRERCYGFIKRVFDVVASACALVILMPLFLFIAVLIFLDDPRGNPFFSQQRVGRDGCVFQLYKFRTMVVEAETLFESVKDQNEASGHAFKMKDDPRITKIGKFLRQTSLDELPQLLNVLRGDMSFVGPRPPLPREVEEYTDYERLRLLVTPGLTCFWQTEKNRNDISFDRWVELDLKYILERNVLLDMKLILKTVLVMARRDGR